LTISPPDVLLGVQTPRYLSLPEVVVSSAGPEAVELAADAGLLLDPWQQVTLEHALAEQSDGRWAAGEVAEIVPRQNGKGGVLEARELAGLFLLGEELLLHSAHEFKTAQEAFRRVLGLIQNAPDLDRLVMRVRTSHGEEGIELVTGQRLRFVARSGGSGRGFSGDVVILDEAMILTAEVMAALLPTLSARPNPQVWYTGSAPFADDRSAVLRRVCRRGRAGKSARMVYLEWCAEYGVSLDDRRAWADANPGLGIRISEDAIAMEREAMDDETFARERLGIWYEDEVESVIPRDTWERLADPKSQMVDPVAFAVDVTPERSSGAVAAAGRRADGLLHVEVIDHHPGTGWIVPRLADLVGRHKVSMVTLDQRAAAGALIPDIETQSAVARKFTPANTGDLVQACGGFYDDTVNNRLRHLDQPELNVALFGARKRDVADAWAWHRKHSTVDISPLVAATLARWAAAQTPDAATPFFASWQ
jgi:hypothetical protein